jgi:hypothetical protein
MRGVNGKGQENNEEYMFSKALTEKKNVKRINGMFGCLLFQKQILLVFAIFQILLIFYTTLQKNVL